MNTDYVFYFKKIVDEVYPNEIHQKNKLSSKTLRSKVDYVADNIQNLSDDAFIEVITGCFIPDMYKGMGQSEKLFTKLTELMVGEWWRRLGGDYSLPTKKSGTEDVELKYNNKSILCDAKVFRLGRSQKSPNVKDFLKLASVRSWIKNHKKDNNIIVGALVTYPSLFEWKSDSEVYEECTNHETHVVMLPYEIMALLLKYKKNYDLERLIEIWDYNGVNESKKREDYWNFITPKILDLLHVDRDQFDKEIDEIHDRISDVVEEYLKEIENTEVKLKNELNNEITQYNNPVIIQRYFAEKKWDDDDMHVTLVTNLNKAYNFRRFIEKHRKSHKYKKY